MKWRTNVNVMPPVPPRLQFSYESLCERHLEEMDNGKQPEEILPFWRLINGTDRITKRLDIDPCWVNQQRQSEYTV